MAIVGYWRFNGNANDASGNGLNGTLVNSPVSKTCGKKDGALTFVEDLTEPFSSSNVTLPIGASLKGRANATVSLWAYITGNPANDPKYNSAFYYESSDVEGYGRFAIYNTWDGNVLCQMRDTSTGSSFLISVTGGITLNQWVHFTLTFNENSNELFFYKNGIKVGENTVAKGVIYNTDPLYISIGAQIAVINILSLNGSVDEVILDGSTWSPSQVKNEYSRNIGFF